jgi:CRP-like cAMP-binding protein
VPGALIWAAGMAYFATTLGVRADFLGGWLPGMLILGLGAGLTFPTLSAAAVSSVPGPRFAIATSLSSVSRQLGAALGVAALIAIIGTPSAAQALHAFEHGWLFAGGCFLAGAVACLVLVVKGAGSDSLPQPPMELVAVEPSATATPAAAKQLPRLVESEGERAEVAPQSVAEFLRNVPVFAALSPAMREELAGLARSIRLAGQQWLFREGEDADGVYVVRVGHLEVISEAASEPQTINTLTRGAVLGELALLSGSLRSASVRALRDTELLRIDRTSFDSLLRREPELALSLTRVLSTQLQASRALPVARRPRPVTIALRAISPEVPALEIADQLSRAMCAWGSVAVLYPDPKRHAPGDSRAGESDQSGADSSRSGDVDATRAAAIARFGPLVERCELDHDQVIMVCGSAENSTAWDEFCTARADRLLVVVSGEEGHRERSANGPDSGKTRSSERVLRAIRLLPGCVAQTSSAMTCSPAPRASPAGSKRSRPQACSCSAPEPSTAATAPASRGGSRGARSAWCSQAAAHAGSRTSARWRCCSTPACSSTASAASAWARSSAACSPADTTALQSTPAATRSGCGATRSTTTRCLGTR